MTISSNSGHSRDCYNSSKLIDTQKRNEMTSLSIFLLFCVIYKI